MSKHATQDPNGTKNTTETGSTESTSSTSMSSPSSSDSDSDNPVGLSHDAVFPSTDLDTSSASFLNSGDGAFRTGSSSSYASRSNALTRYSSSVEFSSHLSPYQLSVCEKLANDIYKLGMLTGMPLTVAYTTSFSIFEFVQSFVSGFPEVAPAWINSFARYQVSPLAFFVYLPLVWGELKKHVPGVADRLPDITFLRSEQLIPVLMAAMDGVTVANLSFDWIMEMITIFARWAEHLSSDADVDISFWLGPTFFAACAALGVVTMAASWIQAYNETHPQQERSLTNHVVTHWLAKATIGAINGGGVAHAALKAGFTLNGFTSQDFEKNWVQIALLAFSSSVSVASGVFFGVTWHLYDKLERSLTRIVLPRQWLTDLSSDIEVPSEFQEEVESLQAQVSDYDSETENGGYDALIPADQALILINSQDGQGHAAVTQEKLENIKTHITRYTLVLTLLSMGLIIGSFVNFLYNQKGDVDPVQSAIHARIVNFLSYFLWDGGLAAATVVAAFVLIVTKCFEKGSIRELQVQERPALRSDSALFLNGPISESARLTSPRSVTAYGSAGLSTEPKPVPDPSRVVVESDDAQSYNQPNSVLNIQYGSGS